MKKLDSFIIMFDKEFKKLSIDASIHTANTGSKYYSINNKEYRIADHSKKNKFGNIEFFDNNQIIDQISDLIDSLESDNIDVRTLSNVYKDYLETYDKQEKQKEESIKKAKSTRLNNEFEQIEQFKNDVTKPQFKEKLIQAKIFSKSSNKLLISRTSYIWDFVKLNYPKITKFNFENEVIKTLKENFPI